LNLISIFPAVR